MNLKQCVFIALFFINVNVSFSQIIFGTIFDVNGTPIDNASVTIYNSKDKDKLLAYCFSNHKGDFYCDIKNNNPEVFIEVSCINYQKAAKVVTDFSVKNIFILQNKEFELDEVKIVAEKPVRIKNDSVFYDPKKFLDGTEKKVQDLLKKLPGITVNETTGQIKYKGKNVETVKLEGDDLFGSNYAVGTKNLAVGMVDQVQAIENYSTNPLLKNIEETDKVILNLKLKKGETDFSGSATLDNGYGNKIFLANDATVLGISKKIKSFGVAAYSNFGVDTNNSEPNSDDTSNTKFSNEDLFTKKNLLENASNSFLPARRTNFNDNLFTNYNLVYKVNSKMSIKNNFYYFFDKLRINEVTNTEYFVENNQTIENTTENNFYRNPNYFRADTKLTVNTSKVSLLQIDFDIKNQIVNSSVVTVQNSSNPFFSQLKTNDFFIKLKAEYTLKLNAKSALQLYALFSKNDVPQELIFSPNNSFITGTSAENSTQTSNFVKQVISNKLTYLVNNGHSKSLFTLGTIQNFQPFESKLNENGVLNPEFQNNFDYKKANVYFEYSSAFKIKNFKIQPFLSLNYYIQKIVNQDNLIKKQNNFAINYFVVGTYSLSKNASVFAISELEQKTPNEDFLFTNKVILGNTSVKNNLFALDLLKSNNTTIGYKYENLFKQFTFKLNFQYQNNTNTFLTNIQVNPNFITYTSFQNANAIETKKVNLIYEKLISKLKTSVKNAATFGINNYQNSIDNFVLRNNKATTFENNVYVSTFLNFPINIENKLNFSIYNFESDGFTNQRKSLTNTFKTIIKPFNNWIVSVSQEYYDTDINLNSSFSFIDFDLQYKAPNKKGLSFNIYGKNLGNIKSFNQATNSDYFNSLYQSQLLPRHFLLSMNLDF